MVIVKKVICWAPTPFDSPTEAGAKNVLTAREFSGLVLNIHSHVAVMLAVTEECLTIDGNVHATVISETMFYKVNT